MNAPSILQRALFVIAAVAMLAVSGTMAWATVNEYEQRGFVPSGVSIDGTDLSGMDAEQAAAAIEQTVGDPLSRPVTVESPIGTKTFQPEEIITVDTEAMLDDAYQPRARSTFAKRLANSFGQPIEYEVKPQYAMDSDKMLAWIKSQAKKVNRDARDAKVTVKGNKPVVTKEVIGRWVKQQETLDKMADAVQGESREITMTVKIIQPKIKRKDLPKLIVVDKSERQLTLYKGDKKLRSWGVAVGQPAYPTPEGKWTVVNKRYMPTWTNPGSGWAASMPPYIAPGYSNPLGLRALDLDASGIRIHGTANIGSIGTAASHGCIRMANSNIVELYPLVPVKTAVWVVP